MRAIDRARRKKEKNECEIKVKNSAMTPSLEQGVSSLYTIYYENIMECSRRFHDLP